MFYLILDLVKPGVLPGHGRADFFEKFFPALFA
jgi:hypothetical protein